MFAIKNNKIVHTFFVLHLLAVQLCVLKRNHDNYIDGVGHAFCRRVFFTENNN